MRNLWSNKLQKKRLLLSPSRLVTPTYFLGRTLILYVFMYFIFILLHCYHDILQLQKVAIQGFELRPCYMIQIFASRALPLSQLEVFSLDSTSSKFISSESILNTSLRSHHTTTMPTVMGHDDNHLSGGDDNDATTIMTTT
jgi:hypothetical protein